MRIIVLKFGGSCLGTPEQVAQNLPRLKMHINRFMNLGYQPVIVVSALAGETRQLKQRAEAQKLDARETDQLLASGEIHSARLVTQYLKGEAISASDFTGEKLPLYSDNNYGAARIDRVEVSELIATMKKGIVPVVPGFIATSEQGRLATLGFEGSDITALALAGALKAKECILFKDVPGIYAINPNYYDQAEFYDNLSYDDLILLAQGGASIVHHQAALMAKQHGVPLTFKAFYGWPRKMSCVRREIGDQQKDVIGLHVEKQKENLGFLVRLVGGGAQQARENLFEKAQACGLPVTKGTEGTEILLANSEELKRALKIAAREFKLSCTIGRSPRKPFTPKP